MELIALADQISKVRYRISKEIDFAQLDQVSENAFAFVDQRLREMEDECRSGVLRPVEKRWPELSRIAEETHPAILPPSLGGQLIEVEKSYRQA